MSNKGKCNGLFFYLALNMYTCGHPNCQSITREYESRTRIIITSTAYDLHSGCQGLCRAVAGLNLITISSLQTGHSAGPGTWRSIEVVMD